MKFNFQSESAVSRLLLAVFFSMLLAVSASAQRQMERLGRGVVALHSATSQAYVGWRLLATDPTDVGFNLYRSTSGGTGVKLNSVPLTNTTDFLDTTANFTVSNAWYVVPVTNGVEGTPGAAFGLAANPPVHQYLSWPLHAVVGGAFAPYDVKFCWVGDLDGDGEYDYVVDRQSTLGATNQYLQAYKRDGTFLWQMDMGYNSVNQYNIEPGASAISIGDKDNVTVYDLDGDGYAEVCVRTARGVVLPDGTTITGPDDTTQYLSILNGLTGHEMARVTITNLWPADGPLNSHFGIMYCDGVHPSLVVRGENRNSSGAFQRETMAYDYRNGQLTRRWFFTPSAGQNLAWGHSIRIMDVNHDGIDDLIDVGSAMNGATGQPLWDTELGHGDRFHVTDIDPDRPGLEMFSIQQLNPTLLATALIDMGSGAIIKKWYSGGITDVGRGIALDMDPNHRGCEFYSTQPGIFDCKGNQIFANSIWPPEGLWWDADLSREFIDGAGSGALAPVVNKFDPNSGTAGRMYTIYNDNGGVHQAYGGRPAFWGDILGDWREELVLVANDYSELRVYVSKLTATNRLYCLMQNPAYRDQCTCKGYYQASYVDYFLGNQMPPPPPPPVSNAKLVWRGDGTNAWDAATTANWFTNWFYVGNANTNPAPFTPGDTVLFDLTGSNNAAITLTGSLTPGDVRVHAPKNYTFNGDGSLDGAMGLTKAGAGKLFFNGTNNYTGKTLIAEGPFVVNGSLPNSPMTVRGGVWLDGRLGGNGVVGSAVSIYEGAGVSPGQGTNSPGTLTIANNLTLAGRTLNDFDLSDDPTGTTKTNDLLAVSGNLTLQGTNTFVIHRLNTNLPPGTVYPLVNYSGTLSGSLNNFIVSGLTGIPYALTNPPGQIALVVKSYRAPATVTWTGGSGGNAWDLLVSSNWFNGAAKDQFAPNDTVRFDNTGATNPVVNLTGDLNASNLVVDTTSNYSFTGSGNIFGPCSLTKTNSGTLTISALNNTFTGKTILAGGTLVVSELDALGFPSPLGNPPGGSTNLILSGNSTLRITGESYTERGLTLNAGTNTIEVLNGSDQVTIAGQIVGSGALLKAGAGALALTVSNGYTGGTFIYGGSVSLGSVAGNQYGLGSGLVTLSNVTLSLIDIEASENIGWNMNVPTNSVNYLNCDGRSTMSGSLTGGGALNVFTPYVRTDFSGNWSAFTGQINATGGNFRVNNSAGYPLAKFYVGSAASLQNRVGGTPTISIGELSGAQGGAVSGGTGNDGIAANWSVGGLNTSATFAGNTYNNVGFIKVGTGTWTMSGTNISHTGQTTVNGGTLLINGNAVTASGAVTVTAAGTLGGTGIIGGATTINGRLAPGNSPGTLSFSNSLIFTASGSALMEISKSPLTNDLAKVQTTLTYNGALIVTNVGGGTLASGDSFKIFDATTYAGSFASLTLPPLAAGLAWNTTTLNTSGTLSVIGTNALPPPPAAPSGLAAAAVSASQINLTWTDNSTNESNFLVERSPDNTNFTQVISVGAGVTNASDTGLAANTVYYYRVRASNSGGNSAFSNTANATTLPAPTALVWRGDGVANAWDVGVTSNWLAGGNSTLFANGVGVIFDDTGSNNVAVTLNGTVQPASTTFSAAKNYTLAGTGGIAGTNALVKSGAGILSIGISNSYSGGTYVSGGAILFTSDSANAYGLGTNTITLTNATLTMYDNYSSYNSATWNLAVPAGATATLNADSRCDLYGTLSGGGTLNLNIPNNRTTIYADWSAFTGTINALPAGSGGKDFRIGPSYSWSGLPNAALNLGTNIYAYWTGNLNSGATGSFADIGELSGDASARLEGGNIGGRILTYRVGNRNTDATFAGNIIDQSASSPTLITKVGTGTWTLTGANTYSGVTTISGGTLQVGNDGTTGTLGTNNIVNNATLAFNRADAISDSGIISGTGSLAQIGDGTLTLGKVHIYTGATVIQSGTLALTGSGSIANSTNINISAEALFDVSGRTGGGLALASGQTLSGNGAVKGNFTFASGAKLEPGNSIGTLTFSNSLALSAGSSTKMEISKAPIASDAVNVLGNLTYGGALTVTNISGVSLTAGDSFPLFNAAAHSGSFSSLTLPPLGANLAWDTNNFLASGTLAVISTAPPVFSAVAPLGDGNFRLTFSGPTGKGFELRATTNLMLVPLTLWDLLDSDNFGSSPVIYDDLSATNYPQRFYRILVP
jgi:autotransporter-associated beta strand protein